MESNEKVYKNAVEMGKVLCEGKKIVIEYARSLLKKDYSVSRLYFLNQVNNPPELVCIEKLIEK